jgi:hypothetical protein
MSAKKSHQLSREVVSFLCRNPQVDTVNDDMQGSIMNIARPFGPREIEKSAEVDVEGNIRELARGSAALRPAETGEVDMTANNLGALLQRVSGTSAREIDNLIGELQSLREKLRTDGSRLQRDITEYASLSQQVMQVTKIISESVRKLPDAPGAADETPKF